MTIVALIKKKLFGVAWLVLDVQLIIITIGNIEHPGRYSAGVAESSVCCRLKKVDCLPY